MKTTSRDDSDPVRSDLIDAGIRVLADEGAGALVMRRVASAAGVSTMCVYSRFGDKSGLLDAVYKTGFERLEAKMAAADGDPAQPLTRIVSLALAYRSFALANPALYSLMFERIPGFDPPRETREQGLRALYDVVGSAISAAVESGTLEMDDPRRAAFQVWTTAHGAVSLELLHAAGAPSPGPLVDSPSAGEEVFRQVVETTLWGMARPRPVVDRL